jgi:hypothetical protein
VKLLQVAPNMEPFPWISNIEWYARWLPEFVVARTDSLGGVYVSEAETKGRFGEPAERFECPGRVVLVYNRESDANFHTYLRDHPFLADR